MNCVGLITSLSSGNEPVLTPPPPPLLGEENCDPSEWWKLSLLYTWQNFTFLHLTNSIVLLNIPQNLARVEFPCKMYSNGLIN